MVIFNVYVRCNNIRDRFFNMSDPEDGMKQVSLDSNAQFMVCKNNYLIMQEDVLRNKIFGEWH